MSQENPEKTKIEVVLIPCVYALIRGEPDPRGKRYTRRDGGAVKKILSWILDEEAYPVRSMTSGGGRYEACHHAGNIEALKALLKKDENLDVTFLDWWPPEECEPEEDEE